MSTCITGFARSLTPARRVLALTALALVLTAVAIALHHGDPTGIGAEGYGWGSTPNGAHTVIAAEGYGWGSAGQ